MPPFTEPTPMLLATFELHAPKLTSASPPTSLAAGNVNPLNKPISKMGSNTEDEVLEPTPGCNVVENVSEPTSSSNADEGVLKPTSGYNDDEEVSEPTIGMLDINDKAGIGMAKSFSALVVKAGGFDKLPFIDKDAHNFIDKARHLRLDKGGAAAFKDYFTLDEFEAFWEVFLDIYNLHEHVWLQNLYCERMYWIHVYLKDKFWAEMSTTQRSESMNAFFDGFVHLGTTLKEFVGQFDNALRKKVENEMVTYQVYFNEDECEAKCMCGLFEMRSILCRHILVIFSVRDVRVLPSKYIMDRWREDINRRYALIRSSYDDLSGKSAASMYSMLIKLCYEVATNAT
ncbi:hypothetical protein F2P56_003916 [Juglans regia]|uniref:Protein FAR1-RELATED SEQUENCE n=1 Tax=Juglans regia TaxID=51240 RepID=A0A834D4Y8_JUGRE|nr:hypothetical protein F2P56_003916 [Juglans regia]